MSEENHLHSWVKAEWREKQTLIQDLNQFVFTLESSAVKSIHHE